MFDMRFMAPIRHGVIALSCVTLYRIRDQCQHLIAIFRPLHEIHHEPPCPGASCHGIVDQNLQLIDIGHEFFNLNQFFECKGYHFIITKILPVFDQTLISLKNPLSNNDTSKFFW